MAAMAHPELSGPAVRTNAAPTNAASLAEDVAAARGAVANVVPILRHLLRSDDNSIFSEEIVARVRGMVADMARQLIVALGEAAGHAEPEAWAHKAAGELAHMLADNPVFIEHFHGIALEWQWTERLAQSHALDPVLPPLLQAQMANPDPSASAAAMNLLAAQARFCQNQRRMQMPLGELPGDLLHIALVSMRTYVGADGDADTFGLLAERSIRSRFDEGRGRLGQMRRVLDAMGEHALDALTLDRAGVALFLSALARGSGLTREAVILTTVDSQLLRLALALRASGLSAEAAAAQVLALHPDAKLPSDALAQGPDAAAALLAAVDTAA